MNYKKISSPKINRMELNLENLPSRDVPLNINIRANSLLPKEGNGSIAVVIMQLSIKAPSEKSVFFIEIQQKIDIKPENINDTVQDEIKKNILPELYDEIQVIFNDIRKKSTVELNSLPNFSDLEIMK